MMGATSRGRGLFPGVVALCASLAVASEAQPPRRPDSSTARSSQARIILRGDTLIAIRDPAARRLPPPPASGTAALDSSIASVIAADTLVLLLRGDSAITVRPAAGTPIPASTVRLLKLIADLQRTNTAPRPPRGGPPPR